MAILPDFTGMLNNAFASSSSTLSTGAGEGAFIFTSLLRQLKLGRRSSLSNNSVSNVTLPTAATSDVVLGLNPNMVRFRQPKRISKRDVREGSVFFHFLNSLGQNIDVLTMEFTGNTGSIDRRGSLDVRNTAGKSASLGRPTGTAVPSVADTGAVEKLLAIHNLYLLTRERLILPGGVENEFYISYISAMFPFAVQFKGFYNQVLEFEEDARKPNSRNYRFEFVVTDTSPSLDVVIDNIFNALQTARLSPSPTSFIFGNTAAVSP